MALTVAPVFLAGTRVRVYGAFEDDDGDAADPTTATFTIEAPDGSQIVLAYPDDDEVVREALGLFSVKAVYSTPVGRYDYRVDGEGALVAVGEGSFVIRPTRLEA